MRILTIADAHGRMPLLAKKLIKKYNPDFLVCTGDLAYSDKVRKAMFSNWKKLQEMHLIDILGKKRHDKMHKEAIKSTDGILKYLDSLKKKVYLIYGNNDYTQKEVNMFKFKLPGIEKQAKKYKNIKLMTALKIKIKDYVLIAVSGYRNYSTTLKNKKKKPILLRKFNKLFRKTRNKKVIFMYHDPPYNTKLDKVRNKASPLNGKHIGEPYVNKVIKKYKPLLYICGHMHENPGKIKLYRTPCLNTGLVQNKDYFIINIKDKKVSIKRVK